MCVCVLETLGKVLQEQNVPVYLFIKREINRSKQDRDKCTFYYENTPMIYTTIFHGCKNDNFHMICFYIFLIFAQNIDRGYTLEPPQ